MCARVFKNPRAVYLFKKKKETNSGPVVCHSGYFQENHQMDEEVLYSLFPNQEIFELQRNLRKRNTYIQSVGYLTLLSESAPSLCLCLLFIMIIIIIIIF